MTIESYAVDETDRTRESRVPRAGMIIIDVPKQNIKRATIRRIGSRLIVARKARQARQVRPQSRAQGVVKINFNDRTEYVDISNNSYSENDFLQAVKLISAKGDERLKDLANE
jgi:hypothetical protein